MKLKSSILSILITVGYIPGFAQEVGSFTDTRDGEVYKTVKIGTQIWLAENFRYHSQEGSWAYNNDNTNIGHYGRVYNWKAAKKSCPKGWHLPSDAEWKAFLYFLGGAAVAGGKLKAITGWEIPNTGASDSFGFSALPAGERSSNGLFNLLGKYASFWSRTRVGSGSAWLYQLTYNKAEFERYNYYRSLGCSVRYLKD